MHAFVFCSPCAATRLLLRTWSAPILAFAARRRQPLKALVFALTSSPSRQTEKQRHLAE